MEPKEMRVKLKEAGITCPVSNKDVITAYGQAFGNTEIPTTTDGSSKIATLVSSNIYTYIGAGDEPPHLINFMGVQRFVRGEATEVLNLDIIQKIKNNPCFVEGKIDSKLMFENDDIAKKKAQHQRDEDVKIQIEMDRVNRG